MTNATEDLPQECMEVAGQKICGVRAFLLSMLVVGTFCYIALKNNSIDQISSAAMLVLGFFFGIRLSKAAQ